MPILYEWSNNERCEAGHPRYINDCVYCCKKMINNKKEEINELENKLLTLEKDKYALGGYLFDE